MKIQVIFCEDSFIYRQSPEPGSGFDIVKENENALFVQLDNSKKDVQKQLVAVPWDTLEQRESYILSQFTKRYNKEKNGEVGICYLNRKQGESRLDYLNNSINRIASMYAHDQVEIYVYMEEKEGEDPNEIEDYFKQKNIPWNITIKIHELVFNPLSESLEDKEYITTGNNLINEHKYNISTSPLQVEINELKVKLSGSEDHFVRTTLGHLGILLLEKGNLQITANTDEPNEHSVLIVENPLQQLLRRYNAAITAIMEQYKQYAPDSSKKIAIENLVPQALAFASALSTKSKVGAFFSETSYCSVRDFELTTVFLENVNELLKAPCKDHLDIVLDNLQKLNSQGKAPYLVASGIVLAGLCMIPGPGLGVLALGFTGVVALSAVGFIAAMFIAVTVAPVFGMLIAGSGLNGIAMQRKEDGIKDSLQKAINSLEAALNGEFLSNDPKPALKNEERTESEYRKEDSSGSEYDETSEEETNSEENSLS